MLTKLIQRWLFSLVRENPNKAEIPRRYFYIIHAGRTGLAISQLLTELEPFSNASKACKAVEQESTNSSLFGGSNNSNLNTATFGLTLLAEVTGSTG